MSTPGRHQAKPKPLARSQTAQPSPLVPYNPHSRPLHTREVAGSIPAAPKLPLAPNALVERSACKSADSQGCMRVRNAAYVRLVQTLVIPRQAFGSLRDRRWRRHERAVRVHGPRFGDDYARPLRAPDAGERGVDVQAGVVRISGNWTAKATSWSRRRPPPFARSRSHRRSDAC